MASSKTELYMERRKADMPDVSDQPTTSFERTRNTESLEQNSRFHAVVVDIFIEMVRYTELSHRGRQGGEMRLVDSGPVLNPNWDRGCCTWPVIRSEASPREVGQIPGTDFFIGVTQASARLAVPLQPSDEPWRFLNDTPSGRLTECDPYDCSSLDEAEAVLTGLRQLNAR